mmetsp:Transcript_129916/g.277402  ORF Transcript_129916/g.277402 Transcript_129916/m.277402 type:complete len:245 (-) Transcript_129916:305-1039(-)
MREEAVRPHVAEATGEVAAGRLVCVGADAALHVVLRLRLDRRALYRRRRQPRLVGEGAVPAESAEPTREVTARDPSTRGGRHRHVLWNRGIPERLRKGGRAFVAHLVEDTQPAQALILAELRHTRLQGGNGCGEDLLVVSIEVCKVLSYVRGRRCVDLIGEKALREVLVDFPKQVPVEVLQAHSCAAEGHQLLLWEVPHLLHQRWRDAHELPESPHLLHPLWQGGILALTARGDLLPLFSAFLF